VATALALAYARDQGYEGIITIDGNGKDGVEALPHFIKELENGFDLVQGSRFMKGGFHKNTPWDRYIGIRFVMAPLLALGCGFWYTDPTNAFRAMSMRFLLDERVQPCRLIFVRFSLQHYLIYRAAKLRFRVKEIPVRRVYPDDGSIPTKILGWRLKWLDLKELIQVTFGRFNPR
jgi:dolichol-phosphate mannosyltransferase